MKYVSVLALVMLVGCVPVPPIATENLLPGDAVYSQIKAGSYLKGKIALGDFTYGGESDVGNMYDNSRFAAQQAMSKAGLLAVDPADAKYVLTAVIKDVRTSCMFVTCEGGAAVDYTLTEKKTGRVAYHELIVVPHNYDYPFGTDAALVIRPALGASVGNNIAHMIHLLTRKTEKDLV
jgi:hypothetical protein